MAVTGRSFAQFARNLNRTVRDLDARIERFTQRVCEQISQDVISTTPVDTGQARSNWIATLGTPTSRTIPTYGAGSAVSQAVAAARVVTSRFRNGGTFYLQNNLDYIEDLNRGKSRQQPAGYIERAISRALAIQVGRGL